MKKINFSIFLAIIIICICNCSNASMENISSLKCNKNTIKTGEEIIVTLSYNETNINAYKATLEYDSEVFEEVKEQDFKTLNNWRQLQYNNNTKEFIAIKNNETEDTKDVLQITLKVKQQTSIQETNIKIKDITASEGTEYINITETNLKINIINNNENINNSQTTTNENNQENNNEPEEKNEEDNVFLGILPKTGEVNNKIIILIAIIILIIISLIIRRKYKKIDKKIFKLFITILTFCIGMQSVGSIYATNSTINIKGQLNDDSKIDYEDVKLLQLHLIHTTNLQNEKLYNADMNDDGKINITDVSLLTKKVEENSNLVDVNDIDYTETLENIQNPERGFYTPVFIKMKPTDNTPISPKNNLVHLRVGIGEFSGKVNKENEDLKFTDDMLESLNATLENIKKNNGNVIIRFAYDNFEGKKDLEPSLEMILTHIAQLEPIFNNNKDVISYVELGFFGPWGEMHSSKICTVENVSKAIDEFLKVTPNTMKIGVRTPVYYTGWKKIERSNLDKDISEKGTDSYRIGLYNDGYLGSESDLGTFQNRKIEIAWLEKQALHTLYGGEVVANSATGQALNTTDYISKEGFKTHTTYLNSQWNNNVLDMWKNEKYNGEDLVYKNQTGYVYVENHLGYRFVLRNSKITNKLQKNKKLKINLQIENVGFANVVNDKKTSLVLEKEGKVYEIPTNIDVTSWNSKETTNLQISEVLPKEISQGNWKVYIRISKYGNVKNDNNYNCIQFANKDIWNKSIGANYIGTIEISP